MIDVCPPPTSGINTTTQTPLEITGEVCQCPYSDAVPITGQPNLVTGSSNNFCYYPSTELTNPNSNRTQGSASAQGKLGLSPILSRRRILLLPDSNTGRPHD
jgi:hypothetical protein